MIILHQNNMIIYDVHFYFFLLVQFRCVNIIFMLSLHPRQKREMGVRRIQCGLKQVFLKEELAKFTSMLHCQDLDEGELHGCWLVQPRGK